MTTSVSALVLSYNQEGLIAQAIMSLVEQTCQLDQIVISDDGSTDQTWNVIQETIEKIRNNHLYNGDIVLNRNNSNLGFIDNFNLGVSLCDSDLIMYNAGDDISMPFRNEMFLNEYKIRGNPKYFLGHSQVLIGDSNIRTPPIEMGNYSFERLSISCALHIGASQYFSKSLFDDFGEIKFENTYEDLILGYRALLTESYCYIAQPLVKYDTSGLSGWTKNDYWRKRLRFKETLEQRIIDTMNYGCTEVIDNIVDCYRQYGYSVVRDPSSFNFTWINLNSSDALLKGFQSANFDFIRPLILIHEINEWQMISKSSCLNYYINYDDFVNFGMSFIGAIAVGSKLIVDLGFSHVCIKKIKNLIKLNANVKFIFISCDAAILNLVGAFAPVMLVENYYNIDGSMNWINEDGLLVVANSRVNESQYKNILKNNLGFEGVPQFYYWTMSSHCNFNNVKNAILMIDDCIDESKEEHLNNLSKSIGFNVIKCELNLKKLSINKMTTMEFNLLKKYFVFDYINNNQQEIINRFEYERGSLYFGKSIQKKIVDYKNIFEYIFNGEIRMNKIYPL